MNIMGFVPVFR